MAKKSNIVGHLKSGRRIGYQQGGVIAGSELRFEEHWEGGGIRESCLNNDDVEDLSFYWKGACIPYPHTQVEQWNIPRRVFLSSGLRAPLQL